MRDDAHAAIIARGPRDAECRLLEAIDRLIPASPEELALPVRIVVPSRVLRRHVAAVAVRHHGRAIAGMTVQTLFALAVEVLERTGMGARGPAEVFWMLCRRLAGDDHDLKHALSAYADGYRAAVATVRDLLDAGLDTVHVEPLLEAVGEVNVPAGMKRRAAALIRLAGRALEEGMRLGVAPPSAVMQRASDRLAEMGATALPCRSVIVYGFADVTGVAGDLLERVLGLYPGLLIVDRPPDPADLEREAMAARFTDRLLERMSGITERPVVGPAPVTRASIEAFEAPDPWAEFHEIARRIRALLDHGTRPEGIGIVVRDLKGWEAVIGSQLDRFGIPFSAPGMSLPSGPSARVGQLLRALFEHGTACPADLWLEVAGGANRGVTALLIRSFREIGAATIEAVARLEEDDLQDWHAAAKRHHRDPAPLETLIDAVHTAQQVVALFAGGVGERSAMEWFGILDSVLDLLQPPGDGTVIDGLRDRLRSAALGVPSRLELTLDEQRMLMEPILGRAGERGLGGKGGGVRVLSAMEARGVSLTHLFLAGLVRDGFPRVVREDPLMPDRLRIRLRQEFPDLPVKRRGWTEEAYLFASLVSSAGRVCLSWAVRNGDGRPVARSSFAGRMILEGEIEVERAPAIYPAASGSRSGEEPVRPAYEWAVLVGLEGDRDDLGVAMTAAIREGRNRYVEHRWTVEPGRAAGARLAVVREREVRSGSSGPGPWAGLVGQRLRIQSKDEIWVTRLEALATCPWRAFVETVLGVRPPADPLLDLPELDAALVGNVVHAVLCEVAVQSGATAHVGLDDLSDAGHQRLVQPQADVLEKLLMAQAKAGAAAAGLRSPAIAKLLVERVRPIVEMAFKLEATADVPPVAGAEIVGAVEMDPGFVLRFRADRVDRRADQLVLTDYKTGRPLSTAVQPATRHKHMLEAIAKGRALQAAAYTAGAGPGAVGRYLFLKLTDDLDRDMREIRVAADDVDAMEAFHEAGGVLWAVWHNGAFFPRVEKSDEPGKPGDACSVCRVKEACLKDDSAFRIRLASWMRETADRHAASLIEHAAREGWRLDRKRKP